MPVSDQCISCKNYDRYSHSCEAFGTEIPPDIISGIFNHTKPYPGDHGIRFEKLELTKVKKS